jgi:hypothetical protein
MNRPDHRTLTNLPGSGGPAVHPGRLFLSVLLILILVPVLLPGQPVLYSTIRGTVLDKQSLAPLPGATVILMDSDPIRGTASDENGNFRLTMVPIGKHRLKATYIGYAPVVSDDIIVSSGKESQVTLLMQETAISVQEVEIRSDYMKYEPLNKMATVSVRSFSVDETFRFAGSYNDPARMAANFAGVTSGIDNRNDIIVRGNSPMGLQWRLDGMEIPNPNHFAAVGTTGGPVTVLNNNLLTNSDFFTGAFPAEYGNVLSGIFDMRMRNGNNEKHEFWFGLGWNGIEFGSEGPFSKKSGASYIVSYRYSLLELISYAGITTGTIPFYQDLNLKITLPAKKAGTFTLTGIGGLSYIQLWDSRKDQSKWMFPDYGEDLSNGSNLGVLGITHQVFPCPTIRLRNILYVVGSKVFTKIDTFSNIVQTPSPWAGERSTEVKYSYSFDLMKKFSPKNSLESGLNWDYFRMNFADSMMWKGQFQVNTSSREQMHFFRGFLQWQHRFSDRFTTTLGAFGSFLAMNGSWALEPRIGFDWFVSEKHSFNFGAGLYSQMQPRVIYFILTPLPDGTAWQSNLDLGFTRNAQAALGYNYLLNEHLRFKTELYYQYLYDIPVKNSIPQYALSNQGHEFFLDRQYSDSLFNSGTGNNYGIEFTFERFFHKNYYYLLTASVFNSDYRGTEGFSRNSAFNVNYAFNAVGGYEFVIGKRKWGVMSFGLRATWAGGNPFVPYDVDATLALGQAVYDWTRAYGPRYPEYRRIAFRFGIKRNMPRYNMEFFVDLQYRTNYTNVYLQRIDPKTGEIRYFFNMGFFPMGTWRIQFQAGKR